MDRARVVGGALRALAHLPLPLVHALGTAVGWLLWLVPNGIRHIASVNLGLCLPEFAPRDRAGLLRRSLAQTGKTFLELGALWLWPGERVLGLVRGVEGESHMEAAVAAGRGVILITPHLGSWEMAGLYFSARYSMTILYRPTRVGIDDLVVAGRGRLGGTRATTDAAGVRSLLKTLRRGQVVGILPDQDPGPEGGDFAPFFGQPACTMGLVARLAERTGAALLITHARRLPRGRGYRIHVEPWPRQPLPGDTPDALVALNAAVEAAIRQCPEQYLWAYKRFKTRPAGKSKIY